jgi:predicted permease
VTDRPDERRAPSWRIRRTPLGLPNSASDLDEEIRFHLDERTEEYAAAGADDARERALRKFGDVAHIRAETITIDERLHRRTARADTMTALMQDLSYALRNIRKSPGFSAIVAITLALGIGATTVMFSVVDGVVLRPLPYPSAERLVSLRDVQNTTTETSLSYPEYLAWKDRSRHTLAGIGAWFQAEGTLTGAGEPEVLQGERVSANIPMLLGVKPVIGRSFQDDDELTASTRVIMLSEALWRRRFNADRAVLGRVLTINGQPHSVIGVFPGDARSRLPNELTGGRRTDYWAPLRLTVQNAGPGLHFMNMMGQLGPNVDVAHAREQLAAVAAGLHRDSVVLTTHSIRVQPLAERIIGNVGGMLNLLEASVAMLLLIACANVANLLLARAAARQREFAIRGALGAGRTRIIAQLLAESVVRSVVGGLLGIAVAYGGSWAMRRWLTISLPRMEAVAIDGRVLAFAFGISVLTGLVFGLVPALRASRSDVSTALREGGRGVFGSIRRDRLQRALVIGEVALSFVLLVGAGLLIKSFGQLLAVPLGFAPERIVTGYVYLPASRYPDSVRQRAFYTRTLEAVSAIPGVEGAALASNLPVEGGTSGGVPIEGKTFPPGSGPVAEKRIVSVNYFQVMQTRLVAGRFFERTEAPGTQPAVVVNESFVRRWFPGESGVGKRVEFAWDIQGVQTIVGVVADIREGALDEPINPSIYIPVEQRSNSGMYLIVRSSVGAAPLMAAVRQTLHNIDPDLPLSEERTLAQVISADISGHTASAAILGAFAALALLLAGVGLYGVISYSVAQRTHELGVRAALGARRGDLMKLVLRQGAGFVIAGIVIGVAGALGFARVMSAQLFGVAPSDPVTFLIVALVLACVAFVATVVPAVRAMMANPLAVLRTE